MIQDSVLMRATTLVYSKCLYNVSAPIAEAESQEYGAAIFTLNGLNIRYRLAKTTPTKTGQFVTCWKRNLQGVTAPFDISDAIDILLISTEKDNHYGQFVFPTSALLLHGILSGNGKAGKRGFRVYPPWDEATNKQAIATQLWQSAFFLDLSDESKIDIERAKRLYGN